MQPLVGNIYFTSSEFDAQLLRSLSKCAAKGAEYGECMASAFQIKDGYYNSWHKVWNQLSHRIKQIAIDCEAKKHFVSAAQAYLRSAEYFRQTEFFLRDNLKDPRILELANQIQSCFQRAIPHLPYKITSVKIPFQNQFFYGYFCQPKTISANPITILYPSGYDSFAEELYFTAVDFLDRGFNVLIFDGPGQGQTLRRNHIYMRPDWENVLPTVVDFTLQLPDVRKDKLVLLGRSFGGWLAPRAASGEHRLAGLICDPGQWDLYIAVKNRLPQHVMQLVENQQDDLANTEFFDKLDIHQRFFFLSRCQVHGFSSIPEWIRSLKDFTLENRAELISCPTLVCDATAEDKNKGQANVLYAALRCSKQLITFNSAEGAGDHCEMGTPLLFAQRVCGWIDETLI